MLSAVDTEEDKGNKKWQICHPAGRRRACLSFTVEELCLNPLQLRKEMKGSVMELIYVYLHGK